MMMPCYMFMFYNQFEVKAFLGDFGVLLQQILPHESVNHLLGIIS